MHIHKIIWFRPIIARLHGVAIKSIFKFISHYFKKISCYYCSQDRILPSYWWKWVSIPTCKWLVPSCLGIKLSTTTLLLKKRLLATAAKYLWPQARLNFLQTQCCYFRLVRGDGAHSDGVDVAGVSGEGLLAGPFPQVPQLGQGVAGSWDEGVHVRGQGQGHAVSNVVGEDGLLLAGLQVPQTAGRWEREEECLALSSGLSINARFV